MEVYAENAKQILNELHKERLDYRSEYCPLMDAVNRLEDYEQSGLEPEMVADVVECLCKLSESDEQPIMRLIDLYHADEEGRCIVLPEDVFNSTVRAEAFYRVLEDCKQENTPISLYILKAVSEKLLRDSGGQVNG